jgi:hypothetical protein
MIRKWKQSFKRVFQPAARGKNQADLTEPLSRLFGFDRGTPIDRYYIEKFLSQNSQYIRGTVLEISENLYSKMFGKAKVTKQEILHFDDSNSRATIVGDLTKPETLPFETIDCFICTQTYNFIFSVASALQGSYRLLKKKGALLSTVSGISPISRYDMDRWGDFWRFTDKSIARLMLEAGFNDVKVSIFGNYFAAKSFLQGLAVEDISNIALLDVVDKDYQVTLGIAAFK